MKIIPQTNPKLNYLAHARQINQAIARVIKSGNYILGQNGANLCHLGQNGANFCAIIIMVNTKMICQ